MAHLYTAPPTSFKYYFQCCDVTTILPSPEGSGRMRVKVINNQYRQTVSGTGTCTLVHIV